MNIVVRDTDPTAPPSWDASYNRDRAGKSILKAAHTYGIEMALPLIDTVDEDEVTVVSTGPAADVAGLRNVLNGCHENRQ